MKRTTSFSTPLARTALLLSIALLFGCSNQAGSQPESPKPAEATAQKEEKKEPVTLRMVWTGTQQSVEESILNNPIVKEKFAHVTFEYYQTGELEKLIATGVTPDFINVTDSYLPKIEEVGLVGDLNDLLKKSKYDLSKFPSYWIDKLKAFSVKGELWAVPQEVPENANAAVTPYVLVYNKDIFDKFAVPYPTDKMTWDQVIELAKRFNRNDGGTQYRGLQIQNYADVVLAANNPTYITKDDRVDLSGQKWQDHLRILRAAYEANGNWMPFPGQIADWTKEANIAMFAGHAGALILNPQNFPDINWDLATYPIFRDGKLAVPGALGVYVIPSTSKHKELVLEFIKTLQSPEFKASKPDQWKNAVLLTKNAKAYTGIPESLYIASKWDTVVTTILRKKLAEFLISGKDINTTLNETQEEIKKFIDSKKMEQK
ncbi:ABC transporter substrate-binding protein [Paenibacillus hemerocallicola]|nr:extracellular solute-binding protein [Paenibacillus hemerocallicola]